MKSIILILTIVCFNSYSQELEFENFKLESGSLIWQKIYKTELSENDLLKYFKTSGILKNIDKSENSITGKIENFDIDYKGYGNTEMNTAMYISRSYFNCFVLIELKEGKFRVTLKEMKLVQRYNDGLNESGEISELKDYAIKNNNSAFKKEFTKSSSKILNFTIDKVFVIKKKSDW